MADTPDDRRPDDRRPQAGERLEEQVDVLHVVQERAHVDVRDRLVGRVRVRTVTREEDVEVAETLRSSRVEVERVPRDVYIDEVPQMREEDGVTIIPVVEEVVVRRLVLREEVHIRRVEEQREVVETVTLRTQDPVIEREPGPD